MKVLYLYSNYRADRMKKTASGSFNDNHFYGLLRLRNYGIETDYLEIEQFFPLRLCRFLRTKILNVYFYNFPIFWKFFSYDIAFHVNSFGSQILWAIFPFKKPKWVIYDYSIIGLLGDGSKLKQKILRFIVSRTSGIITISRKEAEMLKEQFSHMRDRIVFIPYGTDTDYFKSQTLEEGHQILMAGMDAGRDYPTLFAATEGLGVKVLVSKANRKILQGKLPSHIEIRAFTDEELLEQYSKSKIIVLPLNTKGRANDAMGCSTLVEAMAMGRPVIATRTFTMESYITDGKNGLLVSEGSVKELREAIIALLGDDKRRLEFGREARKFIEENCEAESVARRMAIFFKSLV